MGKALDESYDQSVSRDVELSKRALELAKQMMELASRAPKDATLDQLTPSQRDEWNLLSTQQQYLKKAEYLEVLRRRELLQLRNLVRAFTIQDKAIETTLLGSGTHSFADAMDAASNGLRKGFGLDAYESWNAALIALGNAEEVTDAKNIPLKGLVERIKFAKNSFTYESDELQFLNEQGFPNTAAGAIFVSRLTAGMLNHDPDSMAVYSYLQPSLQGNDASPTK